jgi:hypothetical protein
MQKMKTLCMTDTFIIICLYTDHDEVDLEDVDDSLLGMKSYFKYDLGKKQSVYPCHSHNIAISYYCEIHWGKLFCGGGGAYS